MKIGIDGRFLTHPQAGGFKTYTSNLIKAIGKVDDRNEYVLYLDREPDEYVTLPQPGNFTYTIVRERVPVIGMPIREQIELLKQVRKDGLDTIHFPINTAPVRVGQKFVITLHDIIQLDRAVIPLRIPRNYGELKSWGITAYSQWTIRKTAVNAQRILTVSNYEKQRISQRLGIPLEQISVTHLAPNEIFAPLSLTAKKALRQQTRSSFGICDRFILGVGYEPRKNISLLIEVFAAVAAIHPDLNLVVVAANAESQRDFQQLSQKQGLAGRVTVLGWRSPEELNVLYNLAEVFVFPSERESFGLPPLEAMACGTPTIAMNSSSIPEVVEDGALLVDGKDPQTWANAILQTLANNNLRSELTQRGLKRASEMTWQKCAEETVRVYYDAIEGK